MPKAWAELGILLPKKQKWSKKNSRTTTTTTTTSTGPILHFFSFFTSYRSFWHFLSLQKLFLMFSNTPIYPKDILRKFFANKKFFFQKKLFIFFFDFFFSNFLFSIFFFFLIFFFWFLSKFSRVRGLTPRNNPLTPKDVTPDPNHWLRGVRGHEL